MATSAIAIDSLDDPRIEPYRALKDRELAAADGGRFIAEGPFLVERLLASDFDVESVLLARRHVDRLGALAPADVPVYVAEDQIISRIVGFKFHLGAIACGRRRPVAAVADVMAGLGARATLLILPKITNTENLGAMMRIGAAFGVDAIVFGPACCDPFYRQAVRVSMGAVLTLTLARSNDMAADLRKLRDRHGFELIAAVTDHTARPLSQTPRAQRIALLLGNEAEGLTDDQIALADRKVTIPMHLGTDSLNVAVAAAVFLYHFNSVTACTPC